MPRLGGLHHRYDLAAELLLRTSLVKVEDEPRRSVPGESSKHARRYPRNESWTPNRSFPTDETLWELSRLQDQNQFASGWSFGEAQAVAAARRNCGIKAASQRKLAG